MTGIVDIISAASGQAVKAVVLGALGYAAYLVWDACRGAPVPLIIDSLAKGFRVYLRSHPSRTDGTIALYELCTKSLGTTSEYLNLGYWRNASTYDEACDALALLLAQAGGLVKDSQSGVVLDVGSGNGDQSLLWAQEFPQFQFVGLNISRSQVETMNMRAQATQLDSRVWSIEGSATELPGALQMNLDPLTQFEAVLALESAFHFDTRDKFLASVLPRLRPGGRVALADIIACARPKGTWLTNPIAHLWHWYSKKSTAQMWFIHESNWIDLETYIKRMKELGYVDIRAEVITKDVFAPFGHWGVKWSKEPSVVARINPFTWYVACAYVFPRLAMEYVVVSGARPLA